MDWIEITIETTSEGIEAVSQVLYEAGVSGVVIEDPADIDMLKKQETDWDYVDEDLLNNMEEHVLVRGYLPEGASFHDKIQCIRSRVFNLLKKDLGIDIGTGKIRLNNVKEEDWANNWKKYFKPHKVGNKVVIKPTWEEYIPKEDEIILHLDPGMAFGTGTHETTMLCIKQLENYIDGKSHVLDVGCGTGILGISSALLGAKSVIAVDIDENAVKVAKENAKLNGVNDKLKIVCGNLLDNISGRFDVIVANIIADAIISLSEDVWKYLNPGGVFIACGIILDRLEEVLSTLESKGYKIIETQKMGEWAVVVSRYE
ncbi:MAG: 50S ribosomal protein L11 methyltransferase [Xylanivirga thermophila]|jgi:ribosomal protein L11 methyltransferase|uniref:50S ribosomal protein L11 methyltransferase n=1 Tax=Xylanivirga thermophila TaxID=2496273 RepID=UPI00101D0FDC|nr:50S ribosomal protein L11 methyltransferase [Xylanivirga thermophila]